MLMMIFVVFIYIKLEIIINILDCCDGSDELDTKCDNTCDILGNTIKEKYVKRLAIVKDGIAAKNAAIEKAKEVRKKRLDDVSILQAEIEQKQADFDKVDGNFFNYSTFLYF